MKRHSLLYDPVRLINYAAIGLLSIVFIAVTTTQLLLDSRYSDVMFLSRNLQNGTPRADAVVAQYAADAQTIAERKICRSDILKAGLAVMLHNLDRQNQATDYDNWERSALATLTYINHALTCLPTDGNIWLRLAMVSRAVAEHPDQLADLLAISQRLAPAEANVLATRLIFYDRLTRTTISRAQATITRDLHTALRYEPGFVARVLPRPGPLMAAAIFDATQACGSACRVRPVAKSGR